MHTARGYLPGLKRTSRSTHGPCIGYFSKLHTKSYVLHDRDVGGALAGGARGRLCELVGSHVLHAAFFLASRCAAAAGRRELASHLLCVLQIWRNMLLNPHAPMLAC